MTIQIAPKAKPDDTCTEEGARRLAEKIIRYWQAKGRVVSIRLEKSRFHQSSRSSRFDIRSDMLNGCPQRLEAPEPVRRPKG